MDNKFLIIVCGLPGSGKTAVARKLVELTDAVLLRTDVIRKELIEKPTYSTEELTFIHDQIFLRANSLLESGKNVVLDAVFGSSVNRKKAEAIALKNSASFQIFEVKCDEEELKTRITARSGDASDANFQVYLLYKNSFDPILEDHILIDNSGTLENTDKQIGDSVKKLSIV